MKKCSGCGKYKKDTAFLQGYKTCVSCVERRREYKPCSCEVCGKPISKGTKTGLCRSCRPKHRANLANKPCVDCGCEPEQKKYKNRERCVPCQVKNAGLLNDKCVVCGECLPERQLYRTDGKIRTCSKACYIGHFLAVGETNINYKRGWYKNANGYVCLSFENKKVLQHKAVMEKYLGRKLRKGEQVHHKNGIRHDNRIENLELWSSSHPSGQRVEDMVAFCKEYLEQYAPDELNPIKLKLVKIG